MSPEQRDDNSDRYQFQSRHVKIARWLRWRPYYMALGLLALARWAVMTGCKPVVFPPPDNEPDWPEHRMTRRETAGLIWSKYKAEAECFRMKYYVTCEEMIESLSAASAEGEAR